MTWIIENRPRKWKVKGLASCWSNNVILTSGLRLRWSLVSNTYCDRLGSASTFISSRFLLFFFFFLPAFVDFGRQFLLLWTVYTLFTHCVYTVHVLKNIKNESHDTIYTFKYYFVTVFLIFNFQFSVFNNNKFNPNTPIIEYRH